MYRTYSMNDMPVIRQKNDYAEQWRSEKEPRKHGGYGNGEAECGIRCGDCDAPADDTHCSNGDCGGGGEGHDKPAMASKCREETQECREEAPEYCEKTPDCREETPECCRTTSRSHGGGLLAGLKFDDLIIAAVIFMLIADDCDDKLLVMALVFILFSDFFK